MRCAPALIAQPMRTKTGDITPPLFQLCYEILAEMEYVGHLSLIAINFEKHEILNSCRSKFLLFNPLLISASSSGSLMLPVVVDNLSTDARKS